MKKGFLLFAAVLIFYSVQAQTKPVTVTLKEFSCGDGCYFSFTDVQSKKEYHFNVMQCLNEGSRSKWEKAFSEIENKCDGNNCTLIGQRYLLKREQKLVNMVDWNGEEWKTLKKKEKIWVLMELKKI
jgi:hypothetical protein